MLPSGFEIAIIAGVVILLFGVNKLPKLGGAIGESIKNFKKGVKDSQPKSIEGDVADESSDSEKDAGK